MQQATRGMQQVTGNERAVRHATGSVQQAACNRYELTIETADMRGAGTLSAV
jgi:hypothetical protein